jgi:hypothetical protein
MRRDEQGLFFHAGLPRPSQHSAHSALYRVVADAVQGLLAELTVHFFERRGRTAGVQLNVRQQRALDAPSKATGDVTLSGLRLVKPISPYPPKADIHGHERHVRFVPQADIGY